jgi:hypothetical protein
MNHNDVSIDAMQPAAVGTRSRASTARSARRARAAFPMLQVTLLSIIVALAFENLLEAMNASAVLWQRSDAQPLAWLQVVAITATIVTMWSGTTLQIMMADRAPRGPDFLFPIGFLALLHVLIANLGTIPAHMWLYAATGGATLAGTMIWFDARTTATRLGPRKGPVVTQLTMAGVCGLGAVLVHAGWMGLAGTMAVTLLYVIVQSISATFTIRGWRRLALHQ